ncbi:MAG TPA: TonB-dependent receptor [Bryobacteraceae bacterium]
MGDARGGQPLANVAVQLGDHTYSTVSDAAGEFEFAHVQPGDYILKATAVGYRLMTADVHVTGGELQSVQVILSPASLRRTDTVLVKSEPITAPAASDSLGKFSLGGDQLKNLGSVLADDPLRAVQAIPGVASNNDFESRFSLRGADFNRIGVYLDGVLLHEPLHTLDGTGTSGSASVFNSNLIESVDLYEDAYPARFQDSSAGALDVHMRDGNRDDYSYRIFANFASAGVVAEGPIPRFRRCSWIGAYRKSYLQYLLQQTLSDPSMAFGISDGQGRFSCDVSPKNAVTLELIDSYSGLDRWSMRSKLGENSLMLARQRFAIANLGWRYTPDDKLMISSHAAWMQENFHNENPDRQALGAGNYREWALNTNVTWMWNPQSPLDAGISLRQIRDAGLSNVFLDAGPLDLFDTYAGSGTLSGGFFEQSWLMADGRVHLSAGGRWDHHSVNRVTAFSPRAGVTFNPWRSLRLELGWGQYAQYPQISQLTASLGGPNLLPTRSAHAVAAIEQRFSERTRLRAEFYDREDRDLLWQPLLEARLVAGVPVGAAANPMYTNSLRGHARGVAIYLQRFSANGLSGWISYAYGRTWMHDGVTGDSFPSDFDQRHTINVYGSYRLRPTVSLSVRETYGSGFPLPGYLRPAEGYLEADGQYMYVTSKRNRWRLGPYQRIDLRINKSWAHRRWMTTLYTEVMNLTNKTNYRFDSVDAYSGTGGAWVVLDKMFPILPSVGVVFER